MSNLKELRIRKASVVSTRKITAAMKMISAAKMRKAQNRVEQSQAYADMMSAMIKALQDDVQKFETHQPLLEGTGSDQSHLFIVMTSDRGLCGGFNAGVIRQLLTKLAELKSMSKDLHIICVGRRGRDILKASEFRDNIVETFSAFDKPKFWQADRISNKVLSMLGDQEFDQCHMYYNQFVSVISQVITSHQLIPYTPLAPNKETVDQKAEQLQAIYEYDPGEVRVMKGLLPKNLGAQIYRALLENAASEQGARMTAMDSATRNASDMIDKLALQYNRTRQAIVTRELIEIISGAEVL